MALAETKRTSSYTCKECGSAFVDWPSQRKGDPFCSKKCYWESLKGKQPYNKGMRNWSIKPCANCGGDICGSPSYLRKRKYCSQKCSGEKFSGENHPGWKGGSGWRTSMYNSAEYKQFRLSVLDRDNGVCRHCDSIGIVSRESLEVHHIIPVAGHKDGSFDVSNGITLCYQCHKRVTGRESQFADFLSGLIGKDLIASPTDNRKEKRAFLISRDRLHELYHVKRLTSDKIGEMYGYHGTTILNAMKRLGIKARVGGPHVKEETA